LSSLYCIKHKALVREKQSSRNQITRNRNAVREGYETRRKIKFPDWTSIPDEAVPPPPSDKKALFFREIGRTYEIE
jgi:hypothetical protein